MPGAGPFACRVAGESCKGHRTPAIAELAVGGAAGALRREGTAMTLSAISRLAVSIVMMLALAAAARAGDSEDEGSDNNDDRRSTWQLNSSLTFRRYFEPFARVHSARACRDKCARNRQCSGWTYYDANFRDAGDLSYKLQRVCVLGSGIRDRQIGNRPGRTSGVVRSFDQNDEQDN
jgi:PAN domain